jgi:DNA invertase Pin-like site-specific DNA recombinase
MTAYAYLRVSTDRQDVDNQRYGLFMYANTHGLGHSGVSRIRLPGGWSGGIGRSGDC